MAICTICGLATEFLKQHMSVHTDQRTFKCDICEKTLTGYKTFANHKKCHMTWTCGICEQCIPLNSRSIHMKRCKNESTTISCEKCPYISNDKSSLNRHP